MFHSPFLYSATVYAPFGGAVGHGTGGVTSGGGGALANSVFMPVSSVWRVCNVFVMFCISSLQSKLKVLTVAVNWFIHSFRVCSRVSKFTFSGSVISYFPRMVVLFLLGLKCFRVEQLGS